MCNNTYVFTRLFDHVFVLLILTGNRFTLQQETTPTYVQWDTRPK